VAKGIQAIRGMRDLLPADMAAWQFVDKVVSETLGAYGYEEIRLPILEKTELFKRSIGEVTDIVEKEMYTFDDRNGDSLSLRPEGTACCVRAGIEHGLLHNQQRRLWYQGPMFRHERPQKGRYRQFYQYGVETFGIASADIDIELIVMVRRMLHKLGLLPFVRLEINSLGDLASREKHKADLLAYFHQHKEQLDEDSQRRLQSNPLRILDSKNPAMQGLNNNAPQLVDYLDEASAEHFAQVKSGLEQLGVEYQLNPRLVRGLDYYSRTVFEWITEDLGAQGTVTAGGRFDSLVEYLGGRATPAMGFAMGVDRLVALLQEKNLHIPSNSPDFFACALGDAAQTKMTDIVEQIRDRLPRAKLLMNAGGGNFKAQMKRADKSGARWAILMGDDELSQEKIIVKPLREQQEQQIVALADVFNVCDQLLQTN